MGGKTIKRFVFSAFFFGYAVQQVNLPTFDQALISTVQQTRLTFDLEIDTIYNLWLLLFTPDNVT